MEPGFGWVDVIYIALRLVIAASLVYFLCMMARLWNVLEIWSPETLRALLGRDRGRTPTD